MIYPIYPVSGHLSTSGFEMDFTGERVVPGKTPYGIYLEHINRYIFASRFVRNKAVLDVACGTGYGSNHMREKGAKRVTGVDISMDAINYAKSNFGKEVNFVCADAIELPFADNCFDIIVSFETIEHIRRYERFLLECRRILKRGGLLICSSPNKRVFSPETENPLNPFHVKEFYPEEFFKLLDECFADINLYGQCDVNLVKKTVEKSYRIHKFKDSRVKTSAYMIAVAKNEKGILM